MARFFNTSGVCRPEKHYMLPAEPRITGLRRLIDDELYFVVHAPRQVGKSTSLRALALDTGTLILFDLRGDAPPMAERCSRKTKEHAGRTLTVLRL